ncbi:MAG: class I SAM-dependent methyltransferase [Bryobacteraceae bacterium]
MSAEHPERQLWDQRYQAGLLFGTEPNEYLRSKAYRLKPGMKAIAVADGQGRNSVWLAQLGLDVLATDISAVALTHADSLAAERGVRIRTECVDLTTFRWPVATFDVAVEIFAHFPAVVRSGIHAGIVLALKPGGLLIFEGFHVRQAGRPSGGPKEADMLYTPEKMREEFAGLQILELLEGTTILEEGSKHQGEAVVVRMVARKPA